MPGADVPMIGKVVRGSDVGGLLRYLYGPGRANEHTDPHLVAGFRDPHELEPDRRPDGSRDLRRLTGLLLQPLAVDPFGGPEKPVWHCSVRAAPGDRLLSDAEWGQVAAAVMDRTGFAPEGDDFGSTVARGPACAGSHPSRGHAGPPGRRASADLERLLPGAGCVPGRGTAARAAEPRHRRIGPPRSGPAGPRRSRRPGADGTRRPA